MAKKVTVFAIVAALVLLAGVMVPVVGAVDLEGAGTLIAYGSGEARFRGNGQVWGSGCEAILAIKDRAGDAEWFVSGYGSVTQRNGWTIYHGFNGHTLVQGSDIEVVIRGDKIGLTASGRGTAHLEGRGHYQVNGGQVRIWPTSGIDIDVRS